MAGEEGSARFQQYCEAHGLDPAECLAPVPRFVRVNPKRPITTAALQEELGDSLRPVPWLPEGFYSLDPAVNLCDAAAYRDARVYGIDAASVAAALALAPRRGDSVLDLCCAPGGKAALLADILWAWERVPEEAPTEGEHGGPEPSPGVVTGVDVSIPRLNTARALLKKYDVQNGRLVWADGTRWSPKPKGPGDRPWWCGDVPLCVADPRKFRQLYHEASEAGSRGVGPEGGQSAAEPPPPDEAATEPTGGGRATPSATSAAPAPRRVPPVHGIHVVEPDSDAQRSRYKRRRQAGGPEDGAEVVPPEPPAHFPRVLVDAECTHDGSGRHVAKLREAAGLARLQGLRAAGGLGALCELQYALLANGYRLLAPGGHLVYSTCSLSAAQNEGVVGRFLAQHLEARLVPPFGGVGDGGPERQQ